MAGSWRVEAEDEVDEWLLKLATRDAARVRFYLGLLVEQGSALSMPTSVALALVFANCGSICATRSGASPSGSRRTDVSFC